MLRKKCKEKRQYENENEEMAEQDNIEGEQEDMAGEENKGAYIYEDSGNNIEQFSDVD